MMMDDNKTKTTPYPLHEDFAKAEDDLIRASLKRSYSERFDMMANLMKMAMMLKKAKITHKETLPKA